MAKKTNKDEPKQSDLPGVEGVGVSSPRIPAIDKAARVWIAHKDERCAMLEKEKTAKKILIDKIKENKETIGVDSNGEILYRYDDEILSVKPGKDILKVLPISSKD